jgi:H/ACA ribonucleoprotein complex subunit 3
VYEPDDPKEYIPDELRPLHHITIFHPHVIYPSGLPHFSILPDELLEFFVQMFVKEMRGIFPLGLLESLRETTCTRCGKIHYRNLCPHCNQPAPAAIKQRIITQRRVKATEVLKTRGTVLYTTLQHGVYRYLYHENGRYKRGMFKQSRQGTVDQRSDMSVLAGDLDPLRRYRISAESTLIGQSGQIAVITADGQRTRFNVDSYGSLPLFDANGDHMYWVTNGVLLRSGDKIGGLEMPPRRLGTVLTDQTLFWVGAKFGFGFYRIGNLQVAFVFNSEQPGINDSVAIPNLSGQLIDSTCVFSDDHCWFFTTMREAGVTTNRCYVIGVDGLIKATASAPSGSRSWLGTIRGKTAIGLPNSTGAPARLVLFSPSSSGIVQVRLEQDKIEIAADFPETAPFVDANTHLQIAPEGIYAAKNDSIYLLQLA